jgi:hypothetical protein
VSHLFARIRHVTDTTYLTQEIEDYCFRVDLRGGIPSGKIKDCVAELYYLSLVKAHQTARVNYT